MSGADGPRSAEVDVLHRDRVCFDPRERSVASTARVEGGSTAMCCIEVGCGWTLERQRRIEFEDGGRLDIDALHRNWVWLGPNEGNAAWSWRMAGGFEPMCPVDLGCGWTQGTGTTQRGLGSSGDVGVSVGLDFRVFNGSECVRGQAGARNAVAAFGHGPRASRSLTADGWGVARLAFADDGNALVVRPHIAGDACGSARTSQWAAAFAASAGGLVIRLVGDTAQTGDDALAATRTALGLFGARG